MQPSYLAQISKPHKTTKPEQIQLAKELFGKLSKTDPNLSEVRIKVARKTGIFI